MIAANPFFSPRNYPLIPWNVEPLINVMVCGGGERRKCLPVPKISPEF